MYPGLDRGLAEGPEWAKVGLDLLGQALGSQPGEQAECPSAMVSIHEETLVHSVAPGPLG